MGLTAAPVSETLALVQSAMPNRGSTGAAHPGGGNCFRCPSRERSPWRDLAGLELSLLNRAKTTRVHPRGEAIFRQGDRCTGIYCVASGIVSIKRAGPGRRQTLLRLHRAGDPLGHQDWFADDVHAETAEAITECRVCFIERESFQRLVRRNPGLLHHFLVDLARDSRRSEESALAYRFLPVRARLTHALLVLKEHFGEVDEQGDLSIELPVSRVELASMIGARPESLSRAIRELDQAGVVRFRGRSALVPDLDALLDELDRPRGPSRTPPGAAPP